jgi:UDP-N-acetylglucosamine:LPS N-acetylglucosamine transferase
MAFPEFDEGKRKILFFSRGRGRGHAIPDMEIVKELTNAHEDVEVRLVSYGTGARTIQQYGFPLIDVGLPERGSHTAMTMIAGQLIGSLDPDLVVSHEEFAALPVAKIFNKRTVCITDWFVEPEQLSMACLGYADKVLFIDESGIFEEPPCIHGRVEYIGPILREFQYGPEDRDRARSELNIPSDALVVAVLPGSPTEEEVPIFDTVMKAYDALDRPSKFLIWVAGSDHQMIGARLAGRQDVLVLEFDPVSERSMVAADLAVT